MLARGRPRARRAAHLAGLLRPVGGRAENRLALLVRPAGAAPRCWPGSAPCGAGRLIRDGHQFHRPSSSTVEGTSRVRTRKVSIRMPSDRPTARLTNWLPPEGVTLASDGRKRGTATAAMTQATMMTQRKRTESEPIPRKILSMCTRARVRERTEGALRFSRGQREPGGRLGRM